MATMSEHHRTLTNGVGKCSVPMWAGGCPAGFCDRDAFGHQTTEGKRRYSGYVPALACPMHGGPAAPPAPTELDATRDRVAELERERDEANAACADSWSWVPKLAAREAECAELRAALRSAMEMVRLWHGMGMDTASEQRAWKLYEEGAPEWQPLRDVRDRPPGGTEALRAWGVKVASEAWERGRERAKDDNSVFTETGRDSDAAAIVASLLSPTTLSEEAEGGTQG